MQKETFKVSIINQVKDKNSAFHIHMLSPGFGGPKYTDYLRFQNYETGLGFVVESIRDSDDFQVVFYDLDESSKINHPVATPYIADTVFPEIKIEKFIVCNTTIIFRLSSVRLAINGNLEFKTITENVTELSIDTLTGKVTCVVVTQPGRANSSSTFSHGAKAVEKMFTACKVMRESTYGKYIDACVENEIPSFRKIHWGAFIQNKPIEFLETAILKSCSTGMSSAMMQIVFAIRKLDFNKN